MNNRSKNLQHSIFSIFGLFLTLGTAQGCPMIYFMTKNRECPLFLKSEQLPFQLIGIYTFNLTHSDIFQDSQVSISAVSLFSRKYPQAFARWFKILKYSINGVMVRLSLVSAQN